MKETFKLLPTIHSLQKTRSKHCGDPLCLSACGYPYLLELSALGAQEDHTVAVVDVGGDRGQSVPALGEHSLTRHQLGPPQRLVYVQATEMVIDGNRLQTDGEVDKWVGGLGLVGRR